MKNDLVASIAPGPTPSGVLEERRSSAGLLLALLGQSAMRRLRAAVEECASLHERESERVERWLTSEPGRP